MLARRARRLPRRLPVIGLPKEGYNPSFGGDRTSGVPGTLTIRCWMNGKEGAAILLPMPKQEAERLGEVAEPCVPRPEPGSGR